MEISSLTCLLLALCSISWAAKINADPKKVIATVNDVSITHGELEKTYSQNLMFVSHKKVTRQGVLNNLIDRILGIQRAKKGKLYNNPVVKKKMEDVLYHAQISKELEPELKGIKEITDKDLRLYYKNNPEYRTANLLLRVRPQPEKKEWQAALLQAKKIYVALKQNPKKFSEYAKKYGQSTSAPPRGRIGISTRRSYGSRILPCHKRKGHRIHFSTGENPVWLSHYQSLRGEKILIHQQSCL